MDWMAFFFAIRHDEFDYIESTLMEYAIGGYIIAAETSAGVHKDTDGEHFHFCVQMTDTDYHSFSKRLKVKYSLSGRATVNTSRQYGKVKEIENLELMKAYTIKSGNIRSNLTEEELEHLKGKSYEKNEKKTFEKELIEKFDTSLGFDSNWINLIHTGGYEINWNTCAFNFERAQNVIIQHYLEKNAKMPPPSILKNHVKLYFATRDMNNDIKAQIMVRFMDLKNPFRGCDF